MNFSPVRFLQWGAIAFFLVLVAGLYWKYQGKYETKAGVQMNTSQEGNLPSGLMGYWTFDGDDIVGGTVYDRSGNSKDGTATGTTKIIGKRGQGLLFNGTSDVISLGNVGNGVKTVAFWVKPNSITQPFIDLNGTATVDVSSGTVRGNNFSTPTIYVDGALLVPVAYRSSSANDYASRTNTTLTAPAGIQDGDLLIIFFYIDIHGTPPIPTPPAGFSVLPNFSSPVSLSEGTINAKTYAWYKFASSESGNYTVTHTSAYSQGYITAITGADSSTPFSPDPTKNTGTGDVTTATGLTVPRDNSLVIFVSIDWFDSEDNLEVPTGSTPSFTKRMGEARQSGSLFVADGVFKVAGVTGDKTITNNTNGGNPWGGVLVSVQPSTTPATPTINTEWHHVVLTTDTSINASAAYIGKIASNYLDGSLDEVQFYSSALSASEVSSLYAAGQVIVNALAEESSDTSLVDHWTFDGMDIQGTTAIDRSGNANNGTTTGTTKTIGKLGQGLQFNGTTSEVSTANGNSVKGMSQVTFSAWIKPTAYNSNGAEIYYEPTQSNVQTTRFEVALLSGGTLLFGGRSADGDSYTTWVQTTGTVPLNQWSHIAAVFDSVSDTHSVYINGVLSKTSSVAATTFTNTNPAQVPYIGADHASNPTSPFKVS